MNDPNENSEEDPPGDTSNGDSAAPTTRAADKTLAMPRLSNTERSWFAGLSNRIDRSATQLTSLGDDEKATAEQVREVEAEVQKIRANATKEWEMIKQDFVARKRDAANEQATLRWNELKSKIDGVLRDLRSLSVAKGGTGTRPKTSTPAVSGSHGRTKSTSQAAPVETANTPLSQPEVQKIIERVAQLEGELTAKAAAEKQEHDRWEQRLEEVIRSMQSRHDATRMDLEERLRQFAESEADWRRVAQNNEKELAMAKQTVAELRHRNRSDLPTIHEMPQDAASFSASITEPTPPHMNNSAGGGGEKDKGARDSLHKTETPSASSLRGHKNRVLERYSEHIEAEEEPQKNPFAPEDEEESDDYYKTRFPYPFNKPPRKDADKITDPKKLEGLVVEFSGKEEDFPSWIGIYIPTIHRAKCPVSWKATALQNCLTGPEERIQDLAAGMGASNGDYVRAIHRLVDWFGHPQGLLAARMKQLDEVKVVREGDLRALERWHIRMENLLDLARDMGREKEVLTQKIYETNLGKMEQKLARQYFHWCRSQQVALNLVTIFAWLDEVVVDTRNAAKQAAPPDEQEEKASYYMKKSTTQTTIPTGRNPPTTTNFPRRGKQPCPLDGQQHWLADCDAFKALSPDERKKKLTEWNRCYSCLIPGHSISRCQKGMRCTRCPSAHHSLIHDASIRRPPTVRFNNRTFHSNNSYGEEEVGQQAEGAAQSFTAQNTNKQGKIALQTIPVTVHNGTKSVDANVMMDQGATGAFMSKRLAEELELKGYLVQTTVTGFDGAKLQGEVAIASVQVQKTEGGKKHWVQVQITNDPAASYLPFDWARHKSRYSHLRNLPLLHPVPNKPVDLMLGMDTPDLVKSIIPDVGGATRNEPIARFTSLGWVVGGPTGLKEQREQASHFVFFSRNTWSLDPGEQGNNWGSFSFSSRKGTEELTTVDVDARETGSHPKKGMDEETHKLVARMWEVDVAASKAANSYAEEKLFHRMRKTLRKVEGRYELPTLWRDGEPNIQNNYKLAKKRWSSMKESKWWKDEKIRKQYLDHKQDWEKDKHIEKVTTSTPGEDQAHYFPHFPVVRMEKTSSQVRPVMDGAAKGISRKSLNDCLLKGPKLINELVVVLLRFRKEAVAIAADVKKMFYQILLKEEDRDYHRFLWWGDKEEPEIYRWRVHPFGSAASPCNAIFTIKEHARRYKEKFPRATETIIHSTLVDDNLDSVSTPEEAVQLLKDLEELYGLAGMKLGKFISNSEAVLRAFPPEKAAPSLDVAEFCTKDLQLPLVKALGVIYLSQSDEFSFQMQQPETQKWTRRTILTHEAKLYDPHGFISPHIARARMILQLTWRDKLGWDEKVTGETLALWVTWLAETELLPTLRIPRGISPDAANGQMELHVFCDASKDAYAAAAYAVTAKAARLLISKVKMAPLKLTSIPRLELMAATLGVEMAEALEEALQVSRKKIHFWSDSMNVICWLVADSRCLHVFVGTRVAKIQELTDTQRWHWVDTDNNPADIPSRGVTAGKLRDNKLWWNGPPFLLQGRTAWPTAPEKTESKEMIAELRKGAAFVLRADRPALIDHYIRSELDHPLIEQPMKGWTRIIRLTARCLRWKNKMKGDLTRKELEEAESRVIQNMQRTSLARTLEDVSLMRATSGKSSISQLRPSLDHAGILRVNLRLKNHRHIPFGERHPIIIPKDHPFTPLLIQATHKKLLHAGPQHTGTELSKKYWIIKGQATIRAVTSKCIACRRQRARPSTQIMAPLPEERLPQDRPIPFAATAVDAAGPFLVEEHGKGTAKRYFILFTCTSIRAIHIEPVEAMSAASFLLAFERFTSRRGRPRTILSDNGTNFRAAHGQLRKLWKEAKQGINDSTDEPIEWSFTPPYGPHFGGIYERMIGAVKKSLYHIFPPRKATKPEFFHTALTVTEGIINSRPLTYLSADSEALRPLSPADFLGSAPYRSLSERPQGGWEASSTWRALQSTLDRLWKRLELEMRPYLQQVSKWRKPERDFRPGDVVAFMEEDRRGVWPLGRILEVEKSKKDGHVRRVVVRVGAAAYKRPIERIALLLPSSDTKLAPEAARDEPEGAAGVSPH